MIKTNPGWDPVERNGSATTATNVEYQFHGMASNTLAAVATDGVVNANVVYAPYGEVLEAQEGAGSVFGLAGHRRRFNDKYVDEIGGLGYYGARFYDSVLLGWTQADPKYRVAPDAAWAEPRRASLYAFGMGNPVRYQDPDGLDRIGVHQDPSDGSAKCGIGCLNEAEGGESDIDIGDWAKAGSLAAVKLTGDIMDGNGQLAAYGSSKDLGRLEKILTGAFVHSSYLRDQYSDIAYKSVHKHRIGIGAEGRYSLAPRGDSSFFGTLTVGGADFGYVVREKDGLVARRSTEGSTLAHEGAHLMDADRGTIFDGEYREEDRLPPDAEYRAVGLKPGLPYTENGYLQSIGIGPRACYSACAQMYYEAMQKSRGH